MAKDVEQIMCIINKYTYIHIVRGKQKAEFQLAILVKLINP